MTVPISCQRQINRGYLAEIKECSLVWLTVRHEVGSVLLYEQLNLLFGPLYRLLRPPRWVFCHLRRASSWVMFPPAFILCSLGTAQGSAQNRCRQPARREGLQIFPSRPQRSCYFEVISLASFLALAYRWSYYCSGRCIIHMLKGSMVKLLWPSLL